MLSLKCLAAVKFQPLLLNQPHHSQPQSRSCAQSKIGKVTSRPRASRCLHPHCCDPDPKPCFDLNSVLIQQAKPCHERLIRAFLYTHYWPREPSTVGMYMPINSPLLAVLTDKYSTTGDRWLAFERLERTNEIKPIGVLAANKAFVWEADEYEKWGNACCYKPEREYLYFRAHCLRKSPVFDKCSNAYEIQALATLPEVSGKGVALLLLRAALLQAMDMRHPCVMMFSKSAYSHKVCERAGMKRTWEMKYTEYVDQFQTPLFFPRKPHMKVALYVKYFDPHIDPVPERWKNPDLYAVYKKLCIDKKTVTDDKKRCDLEYPMFPKCK
ncbi:hypothetical protein O0L34_g18422 [Tuta absoluta]|nr:hypothetical protein O0L34_g18422 [Tuta absoluta]